MITRRHEVARVGICGVVIPRPCLSPLEYRYFEVNGREVASNYRKVRTSRINLEPMATYIRYTIYIYIYIYIVLRTVSITLYFSMNNECTQ